MLKDGEKTISNRRSVIRKIFNGHSLETTQNIKFDGKGTFEMIECNIFSGQSGDVYQIDVFNINNIEDSCEYYIGTERDLHDMYEDIVDDETLISMLGGKEEIVKMYLDGGSFNKGTFLYMNYKIEDLLGLEKIEDDVKYSSVREMEGLSVWKIL